MVSSIGSAGVQGLNNALSQAQDASNRIARANLRSDDAQQTASTATTATQAPDQEPDRDNVVQPLVQLRQAELSARANARSIQTENRVIGSLLDIKA